MRGETSGRACPCKCRIEENTAGRCLRRKQWDQAQRTHAQDFRDGAVLRDAENAYYSTMSHILKSIDTIARRRISLPRTSLRWGAYSRMSPNPPHRRKAAEKCEFRNISFVGRFCQVTRRPGIFRQFAPNFICPKDRLGREVHILRHARAVRKYEDIIFFLRHRKHSPQDTS